MDCPQQIAMVVESPRGLRRLGDCSPRAVMAVKTPLGLRRAVSCSPQAGVAVWSCSWESSGEVASSLEAVWVVSNS